MNRFSNSTVKDSPTNHLDTKMARESGVVVLVAVVKVVRVAVLAATRCDAHSSIAVGLCGALRKVHGQSPIQTLIDDVFRGFREEGEMSPADPLRRSFLRSKCCSRYPLPRVSSSDEQVRLRLLAKFQVEVWRACRYCIPVSRCFAFSIFAFAHAMPARIGLGASLASQRPLVLTCSWRRSWR